MSHNVKYLAFARQKAMAEARAREEAELAKAARENDGIVAHTLEEREKSTENAAEDDEKLRD